MPQYGVTPDGFVPRTLDVLLADALERARAVFGADVDLSPTSPLRKLLEVTASEDALLWRRMEDLYYSSHVATAVGDGLDLLGEDLGVARANGFATGEVTLTIEGPVPDGGYPLPEGTVLSGPAGLRVATTAPVTLSVARRSTTAAARAVLPGPAGDVPAGAITGVDPEFATLHLPIEPSVRLTATNPRPFTGGADPEPDEAYRRRLIGRPRSLWTLQSVRAAVLDVPGVLDVLLADPLGGPDVSQSYFSRFRFGQRRFSATRSPSEPYFFVIVVAHEFGRQWRTENGVPGIYEQVVEAVNRVRPIGVHPQVIEADHIDIGVRARVIVQPGYDGGALLTAGVERAAAAVGTGRLGADVRYAQVMRAFVEQPGVLDVQDLRLRRLAPAFGRVTFGAVPFQSGVLEAGPGENLTLGPTEIGVLGVDSGLLDLRVEQP